MTNKIKIYNGKVITPAGIINNGCVLITGKTITAVGRGDFDVPDATLIDAGGNYISPGFIDMHVHGGGGHDFMDGTVEAFLTIAQTHARYGTTAMCPTTLTSEVSDLLQTLDNYQTADQQNNHGAQFLGMHLEGPYFSINQRGAQDERYIRNPDPKEYQMILDYSNNITRWSAAPELPGAIEFGRYVKSKGLLLALAHTDAVYDDVIKGYEAGYNLATHFYSAMSGVTRRNAYRYAGVIESCYLIDDMDVEIIADGIHLPAPLLKLIYKIKGPHKTALITDAMRAAGINTTHSVLGNIKNGLKVIVEDGVAKMPDRKSFAGSVATTDRLVRTITTEAEIPLADAITMMTATPARILGLGENKGLLAAGYDADIVIFNNDIEVQATMVNGNMVYEKNVIENQLYI